MGKIPMTAVSAGAGMISSTSGPAPRPETLPPLQSQGSLSSKVGSGALTLSPLRGRPAPPNGTPSYVPPLPPVQSPRRGFVAPGRKATVVQGQQTVVQPVRRNIQVPVLSSSAAEQSTAATTEDGVVEAEV